MIAGLLGAVQFLTRVPVGRREPVAHHRVVPWFCVVGACIGAAVGGVAVGLAEIVPTTVAAASAVIVGMLLTGAFHEDGLADVADAFGGGWTIEQRLVILKDSRHGSYGVAALASSIVLRVSCVASITSPAAAFAALVSAHALGRGAAVVAMRTAGPATESGLGVAAARDLRPVATVVGLLGGVGVTAALTGWWVLPFLAAALVAVGVVVALAVRKIGGLAGDVLGAVEQVAECLVLVVAAGLASHYAIWWA